MRTVSQLEKKLTEPSEALVEDVAKLDGDIMILGAGGKVGPGLARLARNAINQAGIDKRVIGVARFSEETLASELQDTGIETIAADLTNEHELQGLPEVENIIYMIGYKFGTTRNEHFAWAMNSYLPGRVAEKFKDSRIVAFSTLLVYPLTPVKLAGATEEHPTGPIGEYAQSCVGRERVFEYFSRRYDIPIVLFRLGYSIETRYGILFEIAESVKNQEPIDLRMGHASVIWQGDASEIAIRSLTICDSPPKVLNVAGPETVSVRWLAEQFGECLRVEPAFAHEELDTSYIINASESHKLFGYPKVTLGQMIEWVAQWIEAEGTSLGKPTHFQEREGEF